jgi:hypothetical protein
MAQEGQQKVLRLSNWVAPLGEEANWYRASKQSVKSNSIEGVKIVLDFA